MKLLRHVFTLTALLALAPCATAQLYVVQVGPADGSGGTLTSASTAAVVQKFATTGGAPLTTLTLPTAVSGANQPFTISGSATSEGFLTLSANGQFLTMAGYSITPGTAAVAATDSSAAPRAVARITAATDAINTTTVFQGPADTTFSTGNPRSSVSNDGTDVWLAGSNQGIRTSTIGSSASTLVSSTVTNTRVANIFAGQLYVSSGSGAFIGVNSVGTGLPTGSGEVTTAKVSTTGTGTGAASPYDFWFKDANTLYIADDRTAANGGGIQKWTFDSGPSTWSLAYTLGLGTGARGLAGTLDGGNALLYATTAEGSANRLVSITDTGVASTFTLLATAAANSAYRGVEFVAGGAAPTIDANFDSVGVVDGNDYLRWQRGLGSIGQPNKSTGDSDGDHDVDAIDLANWKAHFGLAAASAVPEPASLALGLVAAIGLTGLRRRTKNS